MSVLLHLSDTHFGTEKPAVVEAARKLVQDEKPLAVVLSGDITQRASNAQFAAARAFCDSLGVQNLLTLPGNHDIPLFNVAARLVSPYGRYSKAFGKNLEPELDLPDMLVIGVNTTRAARHKDGEVSSAQIERVVQRLKTARPGQLRVVVTHQPTAVMRPEDEPDRLHGAEKAVQAWAQGGADLVLGGHIHLPYVNDFRIGARGTSRAMYCVQAGTAFSRRVRHGTPNSLNLIRWDPPAEGAARSCRIERWDYDVVDDRFELTRPYDLDLTA